MLAQQTLYLPVPSQSLAPSFRSLWTSTKHHEQKILHLLDSGGTRLRYQHSGVRGRRFSEPEASLVYIMSFRTARATEKFCFATKQNKQKERKKKKNSTSDSGYSQNKIILKTVFKIAFRPLCKNFMSGSGDNPNT